MAKVLLDGNVYDKLSQDEEARERLAQLIKRGQIEVIATPVVVDELTKSPFRGLPPWFPISKQPEAVTVLGYARLGAARLSSGKVYRRHRGESKKIPDAIIAHSADAMADILVSEDQRCRKRLAEISNRCQALSYDQFRSWLEREAELPRTPQGASGPTRS
jgi:hypothetical protein